ncbi:AraC-like DNA-binding protein [Sphingomonas jejuensis]|uniref:AraC-like DNA-binding protein n=1 Tax=Sphingomonas jejuensis TaxID=904715 RepID=A0ABX0XLP0_9SPHN|nr:helix-turn-helix domain-containing protein [Sphingomonas jejuensis]NJC34286.1 AraC-like DNA-binding protein [Sphingomonas jejuensis]
MELFFGWRSAVLLCAALVTLPIVVALPQVSVNRSANRTLALLLLVLVGVQTPWAIGFAGFYDRWPWLTFLPVALPLLTPPLAFFYAHALTHGGWPRRAWLALVPGLFHLAVMVAAFCLPLPAKRLAADRIGPWIGAAVAVGLVIGFAAALALLARTFRDYSRWLAGQRSDDARFATRWLGRAIAALGLLFVLWAGFELVDLVRPLGYEGLMPLYCGIAAVTVFFAVEGWRHAALVWPVMPAEMPAMPTAPTGHDWPALGARWQAELRAAGAFRENDLTLARAARLVATNTNYLSRACNDGLGISFSTLINRMRAEAVADAMVDGSAASLLDLALDAGFASKASFNRAFAERFGASPSAFRRRLTSRKAEPFRQSEAIEASVSG